MRIKQKLAELLMRTGEWLIGKSIDVGSSVAPNWSKPEEPQATEDTDQVNQVEPLKNGASWGMTPEAQGMLYTEARATTQEQETPLEGSVAARVEAVRGRW